MIARKGKNNKEKMQRKPQGQRKQLEAVLRGLNLEGLLELASIIEVGRHSRKREQFMQKAQRYKRT